MPSSWKVEEEEAVIMLPPFNVKNTSVQLLASPFSTAINNKDHLVEEVAAGQSAMGETDAKTGPQYKAAFLAALSAFIAGTILGWSSPAQAPMQCGEYSFDVTEEQFSWISATMTLGAAMVCIPMGFLINIIGRKQCMAWLLVPLYTGWIFIIFAQHSAMLFIGRFCLGMAAGGYCVTTPLYIGEIAQKEIRGKLGTFFQLLITGGILFVYLAGVYPSVIILSIVCFSFCIAFGISLILLPESPAFLVNLHMEKSAIQSLKVLRGSSYDYASELGEIKSERDERQASKTKLKDAIKRPNSIKALIISSALMFFQQMCGINVVIFYSTDIFRASSGMMSDNLSTVIVGIIQVFGTVISVMIVDQVGRRFLLLISGSAMACTTAVLGMYFFLLDKDVDLSDYTWIPLTMICTFILMFSIGYGPVPWVMMGELYSLDIKGFGGSLTSTTNWLLAFTLTKSFHTLKTFMGAGPTFWLFTAITVLGVVFILFCVPETKNKSFAEIQEMLSRGGKWRI